MYVETVEVMSISAALPSTYRWRYQDTLTCRMVCHPLCGPGCLLTRQRSAAVCYIAYNTSTRGGIVPTLTPDKGWDDDGDREAE